MASNKLSLVFLCILFHQSQGYGVKLQGKVDLGNDMAVMFQDLLNHYLRADSNGQTQVDLGTIMKLFENLGADGNSDSESVENNYEKNVDSLAPDEKKNKHDKSRKTRQNDEHHISNKELKENGENDEKHKSIKERKNKRKRQVKNKNKTKNEASNEAKIKKSNKITREKTVLEEIVGAQENVHVYGKHKGKNRNKPLNNIKA